MRGYRFGEFSLDAQAQRLMRAGKPIPLKPKVFQLLLYLIEHRDRLVSRSELMDRLWPNQDVPDANLTQSIYELRRALNDRRAPNSRLETVARRGFRFCAPVEPLEGAAMPSPVRDPQIASVVVLPFAQLAGGTRDEVLEHALCETLITGLSRVPGLRVRQPHWAAPGKPPVKEALAAGREIGVDAMLDGSVHRDGDHVRVTVRLVHAADATVLWSEQFNEAASRLAVLEASVCERVINAVAAERPHGRSGRLLQPAADDPEVHELFLKCRYHWHQWRPDAWLRAIECGEEAIRRDPQHAPAHCWTGAAYCILGIAGINPPRDSFAKGEALVRRALELDESLAVGWEVRAAIAHFHRWDLRAAETDILRSLELDPVRVPARGLYALILCMTGREDQALREQQQTIEIEPLSVIAHMAMGEVRMLRGEFEAAADALGHALSLDRFHAQARLYLGDALAALGQYAEALEAYRTALGHVGAPEQESPQVGYALGLSGDKEGATAIRDRLLAAGRTRFVDPFGLVLVNVALGNPMEALRFLEAAVEGRSARLVYARSMAALAPLEKEPAFRRLLKKVGV